MGTQRNKRYLFGCRGGHRRRGRRVLGWSGLGLCDSNLEDRLDLYQYENTHGRAMGFVLFTFFALVSTFLTAALT